MVFWLLYRNQYKSYELSSQRKVGTWPDHIWLEWERQSDLFQSGVQVLLVIWFHTVAFLFFRMHTFDNQVTPYIHTFIFHIPEFIRMYRCIAVFHMEKVEYLNYSNKLFFFGMSNKGRDENSISQKVCWESHNLCVSFQLQKLFVYKTEKVTKNLIAQ